MPKTKTQAKKAISSNAQIQQLQKENAKLNAKLQKLLADIEIARKKLEEKDKKKIIKPKLDLRRLFNEDYKLRRYCFYKSDGKTPQNKKWEDPEYLYKLAKKSKAAKNKLQKIVGSYKEKLYGQRTSAVSSWEVTTFQTQKVVRKPIKFSAPLSDEIREAAIDLHKAAEQMNISPDVLLDVVSAYSIGYLNYKLDDIAKLQEFGELIGFGFTKLKNIKIKGFKEFLYYMSKNYPDANILPYCAYEAENFYIPPINRKRVQWNGFILYEIVYLVPIKAEIVKDKNGRRYKEITFKKIYHRAGDATGKVRLSGRGGETTLSQLKESNRVGRAPAGLSYIIFDDSGKELAIAFEKKPKGELVGKVLDKKHKVITYGFKF